MTCDACHRCANIPTLATWRASNPRCSNRKDDRRAGQRYYDHLRLSRGAAPLAASKLIERHIGVGVRRGDLVDNSQIGALAPEFGKPAADNGLRAAT